MTCQICGQATRMVLRKERNVSCADYFEGRRVYAGDLGDISLSECTACGFGCFDEMCGWTEDQYRRDIYNDAYALCDAPFLDERPRKLADWLRRTLEPCHLIDFGGGKGRLAELLVGEGFRARSYDPFYGDTNLADQAADVVTAFEVVEHVPDQRALFRSMTALCRAGGLMVFSTLLKDQHLHQDWWYASPRNGHVTFHTADSLNRLMGELGLAHRSLSQEIHVATTDASALAAVSGWQKVAINGRPEFSYADPWTRLAPAA